MAGQDPQRLHAAEFGALAHRPGGRSERVREAVLAATRDQIFRVGYDGLVVTEVARAAGVNASTIYRRWGGKVQLVHAAMISESLALSPVPDTGTLAGDLQECARGAAALLENQSYVAFMRWLATAPGPVGADLRRRLWAERARLEVIVGRAVARREVAADVSPFDVITALLEPIWLRMVLDLPVDEGLVTRVTRNAWLVATDDGRDR